MTPDEIRSKVSASLANSHPDKDVAVFVGPVPFGDFIWDEKARRHVPFKNGELFRFLGFSFHVKAYLRGLPRVRFDQSLLSHAANECSAP